LPGQLSLQLQRYYAHPRNIFWQIMEAVVGASGDMPYENRLRVLADRQIALWDVCATATRPGSLDAAIVDTVPNGFNYFFKQYPTIDRVCFNGAKAQQLFTRTVTPTLGITRSIEYVCLPSTSPANAATSYENKLRAWEAALERSP
jgi:TDG/mug DNA glycosylase family protein